MNSYEFVFITRDGNKTLLKNTQKLITDYKGSISKTDDWGNKQFAYKIKGLTSGHYHLWNIELDGSHLMDLKGKLNLEEGIVRYLILKLD